MIDLINPIIIRKMQNLAKGGNSVEDILNYLIETLKLDGGSRLIVITYFKEAFSIKLGDIMPIGAWEFFDGGSYNITEIEKEIKPLIDKTFNTWDDSDPKISWPKE